MDIDQAYEIVGYANLIRQPENQRDRREMESLIRIMNYSKLRRGPNGTPLHKCPDKQVSRVAEKLFRKAEKVVNDYWKKVEREIFEQDLQYFHLEHLHDILNIAEDLRETKLMSELEAEVLQ